MNTFFLFYFKKIIVIKFKLEFKYNKNGQRKKRWKSPWGL